MDTHPDLRAKAPLFPSRKQAKYHYGHDPLMVSTVSAMFKQWCFDIDLKGNFGSHTLRKTWGYHQRTRNHTSTAILMRAFGHANEAQTLEYLCIEDEEIRRLFEMEL